MSRQKQTIEPTQRQASAKDFREMTMTKNILIGAFAALLLAPTAASAADLPMKAAPIAPPPYDWTGFYIGATAGGSVGASDQVSPTNSKLSFANGYNITGGLGGGTIGYNWQVSRFVLGFEGDGSWGNEYGSNTDVGALGDGATISYTKETWVATARARLGYAVDNLLFYGTGGYAATSAEAGIKDANRVLLASTTSTHSGWVAGVGLEWGFAPNWSAKFELLHMEYNSTAFNTVLGEGSRSVPLNDSIGRVGVNYRFGGPVVAKY